MIIQYILQQTSDIMGTNLTLKSEDLILLAVHDILSLWIGDFSTLPLKTNRLEYQLHGFHLKHGGIHLLR